MGDLDWEQIRLDLQINGVSHLQEASAARTSYFVRMVSAGTLGMVASVACIGSMAIINAPKLQTTWMGYASRGGFQTFCVVVSVISAVYLYDSSAELKKMAAARQNIGNRYIALANRVIPGKTSAELWAKLHHERSELEMEIVYPVSNCTFSTVKAALQRESAKMKQESSNL